MRSTKQPFRPRAKLLLELGKQLIKDEGIALFELVKNAYDADATSVSVKLSNIDSQKNGKIELQDNGSGMDWETVLGAWLEPGTDYRQRQYEEGIRSPKFHRLPLGQKGIGRFGAHKLGSKIELVTRFKGASEIVVVIDWTKFVADKYLDQIPVRVDERVPELFTGRKTGTRLLISGLWESWSRGVARSVYRAVNSICSPFETPDSFKIDFQLADEDKSDWFEGLISWQSALDASLFHFKGQLRGDNLNYHYQFCPWKAMTRVKGRVVRPKPMNVTSGPSGAVVNLKKFAIGDVSVQLYMYDLDANILSLAVSDRKGLKDFLQMNGGIRVYRDGVRVYDYGEPGNDWLDLGGRRINVPTQKLSNNIVLGIVSLDRAGSGDLVEKTNREGFIESEAFREFKKAVLYSVSQAEAERSKDKERLRIAYGKTVHHEPILNDIAEIRKVIRKQPKLESEIGGYLDRIETDYKDLQDRLLSSAGAGLSLSIVLHEIQKIVKELRGWVDKHQGIDRIKKLSKTLADLIEGYATLVKHGGTKRLRASALIDQALFNVNYRLNAHKIQIIDWRKKGKDFTIKGTERLLLGAIMNLIDNSIWWIENRAPKKRLLFVTATDELAQGPAIIVADNGQGVVDDIEFLTRPFFSRKPDGMGLGLHITGEVMKIHKGLIQVLDKGDIKLPPEIDGAVFALIFRGEHS